MNLVASARRRAVALYLLVAILALLGGYEALRLPASIFPQVTFPIVKVIADVGEEPAARMMPTVTRPLEERILRVPGIERVRSTTSRGSSELSARFAWGTDMAVALQRVQAESQRVLQTLPAGTTLDVEWMNPATFPILGYALVSDTRSQAELRAFAEYTLKPALIRIPGVSQVQIQGGRKREFRVELEPSALEGRRLAVADVIAAIEKNDQILSAGLTERNHELYLALVDGRVHDVAALSRIAVPVANGPPVTLGDLGRVLVDDEISYVRTTANGRPAVLVNVLQQPSASSISIASGIDRLLAREKLVPGDVRWIDFYDQARFVSDSVGGTRDAIAVGVVLAAVVLLLFLRSWRLTLIAVVTVPLAAAMVGLGLAVLGQTVNLMTLAGVAAALGLIADDAIVVVENIHRHAQEGGEGGAAAESGLRELLPALVGSSLSTTVILLPFALLSGITGAFFRPLALTMALALAASFFLALLSVPVAVSLFGQRRRAPRVWQERLSSAWTRLGRARALAPLRRSGAAAMRGYERVVRVLVRHGIVAALAAGVLVTAAYGMYRGIGTDFLPSMDEGSIILDYWTPPGTSLTDTDQMLDQAERVISSLPDVESYSRRTGTQLGFFITEPNRGDYVIKLKPRGRRRPVDDVIEDLRTRIARVEPAIHTDFGQLLEDNIGDLAGGAPQPVEVKVFGQEQPVLERRARAIAGVVSSVKGTADAFDGIVVAGPALDVRIDPIAAARYGLTTDDVHAAVGAAVVGTVVDQVRVGERMYDLRVVTRAGTPLADLPIRSPSGALVRLADVASVSTGAPETEIDRENLETFIGVTARIEGRSLGAVMADVQRGIA
ncbi:MAG TPA: efflux RND transporter permease subunit, partial [Anaeromyxobacter sp.]